MRVVRLLALMLIAGAVPSAANGWRNCNAAAVTSGVCRVGTNVFFSLDMPPGARDLLLDAFAARRGYAAQVTCTQAIVDAGGCSAAQLGQQVTNPETKAQFFVRVTVEDLRRLARQHRTDAAVAPVVAVEEAKADPDVGSPP